MARELPVLNTNVGTLSPTTRKGDVRQGIVIELVTIVWMVIEASVAISVGFATRSVSLQGFGIDSIVELIAGVSSFGDCLWSSAVAQSNALSTRKGEPPG